MRGFFIFIQMEITLHQRFTNKEPILWTTKQFDDIKLNWNLIGDRIFYINDVKITWPFYETHTFDHLDFKMRDGINVVVIDEDYDRDNFPNFINSLISTNNKVFLILSKQVENYWGILNTQDDFTLFDAINNSENIKVFWDVATYKMKNFIFSPKIQIQSYFNNKKLEGLDCYLFGHETFIKHKKEKRIGVHINKLSNYLRFYLAENFINKGYDKIFSTLNKNNILNKNLENYEEIKSLFNFSSEYSEFDSTENGLTYLWYVKQLFEQGMKSEMEVVYETHTYFPHKKWCFKFTEKTIKHLYLGKPFIHTDPVAHQLLSFNGFRNYKDLYLDELVQFFNDWDTDNVTNEKSLRVYFSILKKNIEWLNDMSENEWFERYDASLFLAKENRNRVLDLIYNTSLLDEIKTLL